MSLKSDGLMIMLVYLKISLKNQFKRLHRLDVFRNLFVQFSKIMENNKNKIQT